MESEGKVLGYNKKIITMVILLVVVAGVMFYAGAQYEKKKLGSMGLLKSASQTKSGGGSKSKTVKAGTAPTDNTGTPTGTDNQPGSTPPSTSTTPGTATPSSTSNGNGAY